MNCESFDPPLRFLVSSSKINEKKYLVDLGEYDGNGRCDCAHFRCKLEKELQRGNRGDEFMCKHISLATFELGKRFVKVCLRKDSNDPRDR